MAGTRSLEERRLAAANSRWTRCRRTGAGLRATVGTLTPSLTRTRVSPGTRCAHPPTYPPSLKRPADPPLRWVGGRAVDLGPGATVAGADRAHLDRLAVTSGYRHSHPHTGLSDCPARPPVGWPGFPRLPRGRDTAQREGEVRPGHAASAAPTPTPPAAPAGSGPPAMGGRPGSPTEPGPEAGGRRPRPGGAGGAR